MIPAGFEPTTTRTGIWHSIQLNYGTNLFQIGEQKYKIIHCNISLSGLKKRFIPKSPETDANIHKDFLISLAKVSSPIHPGKMEYQFNEIEQKWQKYWEENQTFKTETDPSRPKYYVLDMFPYPSGAGLHVGHPLGYIASDIYARYKRLTGFNVLHPMGFDAFGLPAEQYAIQTGTHPAVTTRKNIKRYREQLDKIGFSFDWSRAVETSDPKYYKWTQWTFIKLFGSWFNNQTNKAEPIDNLVSLFEKQGNQGIDAAGQEVPLFSNTDWNNMTEKQQQEILMNYRLTYLADTWVNWCPGLGTVLANDEVKEGFSERGGYPVERKLMRQWSLRITAYAQRLLDGLDTVDWSSSLKEMQRNWIGRSEGSSVFFSLQDFEDKIEVFTTRPDTLFGATFMVLAPEHELVPKITKLKQKAEIKKYIKWTKTRSEKDRIAEVKKITGVFTGAYAINPLNRKAIPIWIADYVLAGYGTGAIMAVPAHDSRDFAFARHFTLPIKQVVCQKGDEPTDPGTWNYSYDSKEGIMVNSGFLNNLEVKEAIKTTIEKIEELGIGLGKVNFRLRDAIFSRQRYWGEPFPVYYKDKMPYMLKDEDLPLKLPDVDKYLPTETGNPPLARAKNWVTSEGYPLETNTMPGFAGSSAYYLRYMDPWNEKEYFSKEANQYWRNVDLYVGGDEHATGHLIYSRFWNKFLFDLGMACEDEPYKKLINQGKIQGRSSFVYRINHEKYAEYLLWEQIKKMGEAENFVRAYRDGNRKFDFYNKKANLIVEIKSRSKLEKLESFYEEYIKTTDKKLLLIPISDIYDFDENILNETKKAIEDTRTGVIFNQKEKRELQPLFVSANIKDRALFSTPLHVDINLVNNDVLDLDEFRKWRPEFKKAKFILEDGKYICGWSIEKMSKSKHNVQNPDDLIQKYGADTLRLYEMFLGPVEQSKPWNTNGIEGVFRFLKKFWRLFFSEDGSFHVDDKTPGEAALKVLHRTIKKVQDDIEKFSFNTAVSTLMICVNELTDQKTRDREALEKLLIVLAPFAPHITEELWSMLGHKTTITYTKFPDVNKQYLEDLNFKYPVSVNGKLRFHFELPKDMNNSEVETRVLADEKAVKWLEGKHLLKVIVVPGKIVNIVVK